MEANKTNDGRGFVDSSTLSKDPLFGVKWVLINEKSHFVGEFSPEEETRFYEELPGGYRLSVTGKHKGKDYSWGYTAFYDGKTHAVWGRPDVDAIEAYKVNANMTIGIFTRGTVENSGGRYSRRVSNDGSTLEVGPSGLNVDGSVYYNTIYYKRS